MEESNMTLIVAAILAIFASTGFWQFIIAVWQNKHKKDSDEKEALLVLLHDRLYQAITYYVKNDCVDVDGFDNVTCIYEAYHNLGGNGTGTKLYERFCKLPIKENIDEKTD